MENISTRIVVLTPVALFVAVALYLAGPIPQDSGYHLFADTRRFFSLNNFWNVVSNIPFLLVGVYGLTRARRLSVDNTRSAYYVLCGGILLVAFGSSGYHLAPANGSLVWDRLPMTVAFMALFSMLLEERVLQEHGSFMLPLLVIAGVCSVLYWAWTESSGRGDLRPYVLVQFLPLVLVPLIILMYRQRYLENVLLVSAFGFYVVAKLFEHFDAEIFSAVGMTGGHALKHVAAAIAALCIIGAVPVKK